MKNPFPRIVALGTCVRKRASISKSYGKRLPLLQIPGQGMLYSTVVYVDRLTMQVKIRFTWESMVKLSVFASIACLGDDTHSTCVVNAY